MSHQIDKLIAYLCHMPLLARVKIDWTGFPGAPGLTVLHMRDFVADDVTPPDHQAALDKVDAFVGNILSTVPNPVSLHVNPEVEIIDEATGTLSSIATGTTLAARAGTTGASTVWSGTSGAVISWRTDVTRNGRRLRGRTFLVPLSSAVYETNGTLHPTHRTTLQTAADTLIDPAGGADLGIWGRPTLAGATDGTWAAVTSANVPDMAAVLRSRRD